MSRLVIDASVVVAWLFDDEHEPRADRVLERLEEDGALVPQLWHLETRNSLLTAERRGRPFAGGRQGAPRRLEGACPSELMRNPTFSLPSTWQEPMNCPSMMPSIWSWLRGRTQSLRHWTAHSVGRRR